MGDSLTLGLVQMASTATWDDNLNEVRARLHELAGHCDLVVLPENVLCLGKGSTILRCAKPMVDLYAELGALCREARVAAVFGGVPVTEGDKATNSSLAFGADGDLLARYDKMHLFQFEPGKPGGIDETMTYRHGPFPVVLDFQAWRIALSICYDVRFPEQYRSQEAPDLILCTASFTRQTGQAHWELLLRARAVENLAYVAGAAQCGANPETGLAYFGHSLAVEPWGDLLGRLDAPQPGILIVNCRKARLEAVRTILPALEHRRFRTQLGSPNGSSVTG